MKTTLLILGLITFAACNNESAIENKKVQSIELQNERALNETIQTKKIVQDLDNTSQLFNIPSNKVSIVKGKNGTILYIDPSDLILENGNEINESLTVELKELTNTTDLLKANSQTVSNGQLLESGGAYFINIKSGNNNVILKKGENLKAEFPKLKSEKMDIFYGQKDSLGNVNWIRSEQTLKKKQAKAVESKKDELKSDKYDDINDILNYVDGEDKPKLSQETKKQLLIEEKVYEAINLTNLGWINVDRFLKIENKTNLKFEFNPKDSIAGAIIYLIFSDINSLITFNYNKNNQSNAVENLPLGSEIEIVAVAVRNGKIYTHNSSEIIKENQSLKLNMSESKLEDFKKMIEK